jgi:hypothetical protein
VWSASVFEGRRLARRREPFGSDGLLLHVVRQSGLDLGARMQRAEHNDRLKHETEIVLFLPTVDRTRAPECRRWLPRNEMIYAERW